jgi:microcystin-dependent protein
MTPFLTTILIWPPNFAPLGWALCAGQLMSISQNTAVFSLLGTIYGGDGVQTFALPNLQGRVPLGAGQGAGLSPYTLGQLGGTENVALTRWMQDAIRSISTALGPPRRASRAGR